ncbi:unnamed protein product, partial [Effrenium voratum]
GERFLPPERHAPAPALGGPGFPWQALYDGTKARRCKGLDSEELCKFYHRGEVVVQLADWE